MICYVDTSALVALCVKEPRSDALTQWYLGCRDELVSSIWCVTEFASALGIKQHTGQITPDEASVAWLHFERLCANDLRLLPAEPTTFHQAARLTLNSASGLRAGDALHLATALEAKAQRLLTLDDVFSRNAKMLKITQVNI